MLSFGLQGYAQQQNPDPPEPDPMTDDKAMDDMAIDKNIKPQDQIPASKGPDGIQKGGFDSMGDPDDGKAFDNLESQAPMSNLEGDVKGDFGTMDDMNDFSQNDMDEFSKNDGGMMPPDMDDKMMDKDTSSFMPADQDMDPMDLDPMNIDMGDQLDRQSDNFKQ